MAYDIAGFISYFSKLFTVYGCIKKSTLLIIVDNALILLVPRLEIAKSTIDSSDVAQHFISPLIAGFSQSSRAILISLAFFKLGSMEKRERILRTLAEENGIMLATPLGRRFSFGMDLLHCQVDSRKKVILFKEVSLGYLILELCCSSHIMVDNWIVNTLY